MSSTAEEWEADARRRDVRARIHPTGRLGDYAYETSGRSAAYVVAELLEQRRTVVDFGAGDGRVAIPLANLGYDVTAVDASPTMLELLHRRAPELPTIVNAGPGLADELEEAPEAIYALAVLIHQSHDDGATIIRALDAALAPGGRLILDLPLYDVARERRHHLDVSVWTLEELLELARDLGLVVTRAPVSPGAFDYANIGRAHGLPVILDRRPT